MNYQFYENVKLNVRNQRMTYYGLVSSKTKLKPKDTLIGAFIVPLGKKRKQQLFKKSIKLIKKNKAILQNGLLLLPNNRSIKVNKKVLKQFQNGGFEIKNGIVSKKRKRSKVEQGANKRIKLDDVEEYIELVELVDVDLIVTYKTEYDDEIRFHRVKEFLCSTPMSSSLLLALLNSL